MVIQRLPAAPNERREEMLSIASLLFGEKGYANSDVQVIADRLKIGKGTVYRQFATKEDLFIACLDRGLSNLNHHMLTGCTTRTREQPVFDNVKGAILDFLNFFDEHPEVVEILIQARCLFRERAEISYRKYWEYNSSIWIGRLQTSIDEGRVQTRYPEQLLNVFNDIFFGSLFTRYLGKPKIDLDTAASAIADTFVNGIQSDEERSKSKNTKNVYQLNDVMK